MSIRLILRVFEGHSVERIYSLMEVFEDNENKIKQVQAVAITIVQDKGNCYDIQKPVTSVLGHGRTKKESTMSNEQRAPETKGVTVQLLATVDLGPEIEGMEGRQLRMRKVTIDPGGVFGPIHDHKDRPGTVYILQGIITDHRNGINTEYGPGVGWPEDRNTTHWLENRGTIPAVEISVDIVRQELA